MAFLFGGGKPKGQDLFKTYSKDVGRNLRSTEREIARMETQSGGVLIVFDLVRYDSELTEQELNLLRDIKKSKNMEEANNKARQLVRLRAHRARLSGVRSNMVGISQQLTEAGSSHKTQEIVAATTSMLQKINKQISATGAMKLAKDYEKQTSEMAIKQEAMGEALDAAFEEDGEGEAAENAIAGVLLEAGLEIALRAPKVTQAPQTETLESRLEALKI